jgi:hypothetical protein
MVYHMVQESWEKIYDPKRKRFYYYNRVWSLAAFVWNQVICCA